MCDYCFPPHNPPQVFTTEATSVAGAYPSIAPAPPGVPVNALAATQILLDLIAELREEGETHSPMKCCGGSLCKELVCRDCEMDWPCVSAQHAGLADRAEARLREVTGDE